MGLDGLIDCLSTSFNDLYHLRKDDRHLGKRRKKAWGGRKKGNSKGLLNWSSSTFKGPNDRG